MKIEINEFFGQVNNIVLVMPKFSKVKLMKKRSIHFIVLTNGIPK